MPISVTCPECNSTYRVGDEAAGKAIKCKKCGARVPVPATADDDLSALGSSSAAGDAPDGGDGTKAKKAGGSTKIILIVAGVLVGACCICGGVGGYGVYWAVNRAKEGVQDFADKVKKGVDEAKKAQQGQPGGGGGGPAIFEKQETLTKKDPKIRDPQFNEDKPAKTYKVKLDGGKRYVIDMRRQGNDGDPYLILLDPKGKEVARDDDNGGVRDAQIRYSPPASGEYTIQATVLSDLSIPDGGMPFRLTVKLE